MKNWTFFRVFEIERKTDILALAAFLIASSTITLQIAAFTRGPEVRLFAPEQVMFQGRPDPDNRSILNIIAPMSYVNTGEAGYHATIKRESVRIFLGPASFLHHWDQFVSISSEGSEISERVIGEARPLPVNAGSSLSHETRFAPRLVRCFSDNIDCTNKNFLTVRDFGGRVETLKQIRLEFQAEILTESSLCAACVIDVTPMLWTELGSVGWITLPCWATPCER